MKIIVDIDEDYYKAICEKVERFGKGSVVLSTPEKIIFNGKPLLEEELENQDSVIEKIRKELWIRIYNIEEPDHDHEGFYYCQNETLEIINKYIAELKGDNNGKIEIKS